MARGILFVISAPSGAGKSTLIRRLRDRLDGLGFSISHTTRPPRVGETDGVEYHFVDRTRFETLVAEGAFAEWAEVHGNLYGTSFAALDAVMALGLDAILDIDVQGALQIVDRVEASVLVFVAPPSVEELRRRLEGRGSDTPEVIERRLTNARTELALADRYDYRVVNDDLDRAVGELVRIVETERARRRTPCARP